VKDAK